jgi:hypothetical protein
MGGLAEVCRYFACHRPGSVTYQAFPGARVCADARAETRYRHGLLRLLLRRVQRRRELLDSRARGQDHPGGREDTRMPSQARGHHRRHIEGHEEVLTISLSSSKTRRARRCAKILISILNFVFYEY